MSTNLVPVLLAESASIPPAPAPERLLLYAREGAVRVRRASGGQEDLVLDRKLEDYLKASIYSPILVSDSVKIAIAKLEAAISKVAERRNVVQVTGEKRVAVIEAIRKQVLAGKPAMIEEPDVRYGEKHFKDNQDPNRPAFYWCIPESNPVTGGSECWWNRFFIQ